MKDFEELPMPRWPGENRPIAKAGVPVGHVNEKQPVSALFVAKSATGRIFAKHTDDLVVNSQDGIYVDLPMPKPIGW